MNAHRTLRAALLLAVALCGLGARGAAAEEYRGQRGYLFLSRGANPMAVRWFRGEHANYPQMAGPLAGMALAECRLGRDEDARGHLKQARALDPDDPLVAAADACYAAREARHGALEDHLERAAAASRIPFHAREHARYLLHQGRWQEAEAALQQMLVVGWNEGAIQSMLATAQLAQGQPDGSEAAARELLDRFPKAHLAIYVLLLLELSGEPLGPGGSPTLPLMITWSNGNEVVLAKAEILRREGLLDEAELQAGRRKIDPDDPFPWSVLARLAVDLGDPAAARERVAEARDRWPLHPSVLLTEAHVAAADGERTLATELLEDARARGIPPWEVEFEREVAARLDALPERP